MHTKAKLYRVGTLSYTKPKLAILLFWLLWGDFCYMLMEAVTPAIMPLKLKALGASNTGMALMLSSISDDELGLCILSDSVKGYEPLGDRANSIALNLIRSYTSQIVTIYGRKERHAEQTLT